ncbi:MAG TPA: sialidase family protein, partial [Chthoniobacterales bacterium]
MYSVGIKITYSALVAVLIAPQLLRAAAVEPLETVQDPPAASVWRHEFSPATVSTYNGFTSYQVNVNASGQNITGDAANEPSLCVDPTNGNRMAVAWRQFDHVTSNFRQAGWAYTTNAGLSWTFPGVLESNVFRSDPVLDSDAAGNFFYLSLLQSFYDDMWRSATYGQTWTRLAPANGGDKEWFTIDNTNSIGRGFQYQIWSTAGNNYSGHQFTRSTDGGVTWSTPINIPNSPVWGTLDVDTDGNLFIVGLNFNTNAIWSVRSSNAKNGALTPTFDQSTAIDLGGIIGFSEPINPQGLVGQLYLAIDKSGTTTNNNVYVLGSVLPNGASTGSDVMFVRSTDGGQSFSAAKRINDDEATSGKWHWMSTLSVAPNGRIDVVWLDTRNAANNSDSQLFYAYSFDGGN